MTFDTFEPELVRLLYPGTMKPYYVYKWERAGQASTIRHYPPATRANLPGPNCQPDAIGFRGLMVQDYDTPLSEQGLVKLAWVGIDIDAEDNDKVCLNLRLGSLGNFVSSIFCSDPVVVRSSKSGAGCHVLVPLIELPLMTHDKAKAVAKQISKRFVDKLTAEEIACCVTGLPNMWLYTQGGKQKTLMVPHELYHPTEAELTAQAVAQVGPREAVTASKFSGLAARVISQLANDGIIPPDLPNKTQVNVGRVRRSLSKIGVEFETRSKCRVEHEAETNGYIELLADGTVRLVSNADDNTIVLTLASV